MYSTKFHHDDLSSFSFLITGGAGFVGSNIVEYLLKYNAGKIRILDNLSNGFEENIKPFLNNKAVEFIKGDITNYQTCLEACKDIDYVSHQAALGSVPRSIAAPIPTNESNVSGFLNMLTAAKESKVKRFVYASSSSVYGDSKQLPKIEENIGTALSPYAVSKHVNELYANVFYKTYGLETIGLRYFNIFGPRQNPQGPYAAAIPLFMEALLKNKAPKIHGDGNQTRDFTFVENAVQANIRAFFTKENGSCGQAYNIAVGERISINDMFKIIKELAQASVSAEYVEERKGDVRDSLANITKAERLLHYKPTVKFEQGLKPTLEWFKSMNF